VSPGMIVPGEAAPYPSCVNMNQQPGAALTRRRQFRKWCLLCAGYTNSGQDPGEAVTKS
jgi:hypothetical protein